MDDFYMPMRENFVEERDPALRRRMRFRNEVRGGCSYTSRRRALTGWGAQRQCAESLPIIV